MMDRQQLLIEARYLAENGSANGRERGFYAEVVAQLSDARLYYEAHITVEPATDRTFDQFRLAWSDDTWRVSSFSEDDVDHIGGKWFVTAHHTNDETVRRMVASQVIALMQGGLNVLRYKIEDTILDTKHGDTLQLTEPTGVIPHSLTVQQTGIILGIHRNADPGHFVVLGFVRGTEYPPVRPDLLMEEHRRTRAYTAVWFQPTTVPA